MLTSNRLAYAFTALGKRDKALAVLKDFKERSLKQYVDPWYFAIIYLGLGEIEMTFEALERAYQERSPGLVDHIYVDPLFDRIRSDPRFNALMKKLNLE